MAKILGKTHNPYVPDADTHSLTLMFHNYVLNKPFGHLPIELQKLPVEKSFENQINVFRVRFI